ncbi:MAG: DUF3604 domain-containing protein [marine benthic group bacterium]|nr:DUF3604 domain-containing protein [Gemmatimonadota bacterium]MCL7985977.1 DUF3604 domain-containing protein [Gemmatimonadota bacterium]
MRTRTLLLAALLWPGIGLAQDAPDPADRQVYFGEQHLHTQDSPDAFFMGTRNTPDEAYRFCKGEAIQKNPSGYTVQRRTPYDWCAVTDHAMYMGIMPQLMDPNSAVSIAAADDSAVKLLRAGKGDEAFAWLAQGAAAGQPDPNFLAPDVVRTVWQTHIDIANQHYDPGTFTTLVAFEWTSIPFNQNLHRNVFFRDDGPEGTFSAFDSDKPEDLWTYLDVQKNAGHDNFAIPHNGNLSNGLMFAPRNSEGLPIDEAYAERRAEHEVATEMVQTKGSSDTHPALSPNDEFAAFNVEYRSLIGTSPPVRGQIEYGYVRQALINGVGYQEFLGVNPFKLGIVAGADAHTAFSDNEEFNYTGVHAGTDDTPEKRLAGAQQTAGEPALNFGSPGATGVWADENTREGIFDGIRRKETTGSTGPLIRVRVFGGWDFADGDLAAADWVSRAYDRGVPMGGDLPPKPAQATAPSFMVWSMKDPESGNLDRVQIIKGWYRGGYPYEKVYDVAWSDQREPDPVTGKLPPVGNTVDVPNATYTNNIGEAQLSAVWTDPDFDPSLHAVYYVRVIEIPTPRWSTYDAARNDLPLPTTVPATIQERAWSSPIWYTPEPDLVNRAAAYPNLRQVFE